MVKNYLNVIHLKNIKRILASSLYLILNNFYKLKKPYKRFILFIVDAILVFNSVYIVDFLYYSQNNNGFGSYLGNFLLPFLIVISIFVYYFTGQYLSLSRYIKSSEIYKISFRNLILVIILILIEATYSNDTLVFKPYLLLWIVSTFLIIISRFSLKEIINFIDFFNSKKICKVAIYGAGAAGAQLASALILAGNHKIIAFFDDSPNLWGRKLLGITIYPSLDIYKFKTKLNQILLAIPSLNFNESRGILRKIQSFQIPVLKVPSIEALTSGKETIDSLIPIEVEDLLGRVIVNPDKNLLLKSISNFNICITGAGGSIGREICNQVLKLNPKSLIMVDSSESNLYYLDQEIIQIYLKEKKLKAKLILGDVKDFCFVKHIFEENAIDIVFHAAAYKHVPLLEINPLQGIYNNVFSTFSICKAAKITNVSRLTFISTDKAVRPSNVMGASKRLSELVVQAFADKINIDKNKNIKSEKKLTRFSIVRFGNVLNSSGSVVPLFKKQISNGGPITLTHRNVIRYFMTIAEAAQLVIQSSTLSVGGEVFLLDMGHPIKIFDLAKEMISLSGLSIKDANNPDGDIEIKVTGLRPGEKLYEELLIDAESQKTSHPLIFKANESFISHQNLFKKLEVLESLINNQDLESVFSLLSEMVPEWERK